MGAAACAAHFLEHSLREPQGVLLLVELQDAAAASDGGTSTPANGTAAESGAEGGASAAAGGGRGLAALVEREAAAFGALRKQWAYKLAKQAVDRFHQLFAPYKCAPWKGCCVQLVPCMSPGGARTWRCALPRLATGHLAV